MKSIVVSVISDLTTDQRVIRICTTLTQMGFNVKVIARSFNDSLPLGNYPFAASRLKCFFKKGFMQYAEFNTRLFFALAFSKTNYYLANDLDTLLPNYIWSKLKRKKIFYDTHEYFTGVPELRHSNTKRKIWKAIEDYIFPKLPVVYTVNNSVKNKYHTEYGNNINVVRNVPIAQTIQTLVLPKNWENKTILLMQGAGINEGRGGLELLLAMQYLPNNFHLVFIGGGTLWNKIIETTSELGLQKQVEMIGKLNPNLLKQYTPLAHIGFSLDNFDDLNYLYNLPNKVFDYMHANVPCVATAIPEVKTIYDQYHCGITLDNLEPQNIAQAILALTSDAKKYHDMKLNCIAASKIFSWENESIELQKIYQSYL